MTVLFMKADLHPDEKVNFYAEKSVGFKKMKEEEINQKYKKGEVRIITEQARYPLNSILSIVESPDYILNPEFQRRHRWDSIKKSRLIESILMNVPIPPIFLYEIEYSVYEVMDGLQRLTAISQFYKDSFKLEGLVEWPELNGYCYSNLPAQVKKGIDRRYISSIILLQETAKDDQEAKRLKQLVFERINSGGVKLTAQESRNAIYPGALNDLCISCARDDFFCKIWGIPLQTEKEKRGLDLPKKLIQNGLFSKMEDVELVLRFFAFRQIESWDNNQLKAFFDEYLKQGNLFPSDLLLKLENEFKETVKFLYDLLGDSALWLPRERKSGNSDPKWVIYETPTKVAYDTFMFVLNKNLGEKEKLLSKKDQVKKDLLDLCKKNSLLFRGRFNKNDIISRIRLIQEYIVKVKS